MNENTLSDLEGMAELVYEYCKVYNISSIWENELAKKIGNEITNIYYEKIKKDYDLGDDGWGKDEETSLAIQNEMINMLLYTYKLSVHFCDIIDILVSEFKVDKVKEVRR